MGEMDEKRTSRRDRAFRDGKLVVNAGQSLINCIIRDQTERGAKLQVFAPTALPAYFKLLCVTQGTLYPAQVVWRRGNLVGIEFVGPPAREPRRKMPDKRPVQTLD